MGHSEWRFWIFARYICFTFAITNLEYFHFLHPEHGLDLLPLKVRTSDFFDLCASAKPAIVNSGKGIQLAFQIIEKCKQLHDLFQNINNDELRY